MHQSVDSQPHGLHDPQHRHDQDPLLSGFGFQVLNFGFLVFGFGFRVLGVGCRVPGVGCRESGLGFRVSGCRSQVSGFGFRISDSGFLGWVDVCQVLHALLVVNQRQNRLQPREKRLQGTLSTRDWIFFCTEKWSS